MELLSIGEISRELEKVPDWSLEDGGKAIARTFEFPGFKEATGFIAKIADVAEEYGHHPDLRVYDVNKVQVKFSTHSVQGLTEKDFNMASRVDKL